MLLQRNLIVSMIAVVVMTWGLVSLPGLLVADTEVTAKTDQPVDKGLENAAVDELPEVQTFTGRIVDVYAFMTKDTTEPMAAQDQSKGVLSLLDPESPIALVVSDVSLVTKLVPGKSTYLIVFDPEDSSSKEAFGSARKMLWMDVSLSGRLYEKDGLRTISIVGIHELPAAEKD